MESLTRRTRSAPLTPVSTAEELLNKWGASARSMERAPNDYKSRDNFFSRLQGSTVKSAEIDFGMFEEIDRIVSQIRLHQGLEFNVTYLYCVEGATFAVVAKKIGISESFARQAYNKVVWWVASALVQNGKLYEL